PTITLPWSSRTNPREYTSPKGRPSSIRKRRRKSPPTSILGRSSLIFFTSDTLREKFAVMSQLKSAFRIGVTLSIISTPEFWTSPPLVKNEDAPEPTCNVTVNNWLKEFVL